MASWERGEGCGRPAERGSGIGVDASGSGLTARAVVFNMLRPLCIDTHSTMRVCLPSPTPSFFSMPGPPGAATTLLFETSPGFILPITSQSLRPGAKCSSQVQAAAAAQNDQLCCLKDHPGHPFSLRSSSCELFVLARFCVQLDGSRPRDGDDSAVEEIAVRTPVGIVRTKLRDSVWCRPSLIKLMLGYP
eukprot:6205748-Pleurochrysis_carterae.AAC.1